MAVKASSFSVNATGNGGIASLTFLPTRVFFRLGSSTGSVDTTSTARSDGWTTATNQSVDTTFVDSTSRYQTANTTQCILLKKRTAGSVVDAVAASFVSFDTLGGGLYGFTLNFTAADGNKQIRFMADDA